MEILNRSGINSKKRKIIILLILFFICVFLFGQIDCCYLIACGQECVHAIDIHFYKVPKIDPDFIERSKYVNYNHTGYFKSFFILDTAFIIIYTMLFLSIASLFPGSKYFNFAKRLFFIGAGLDLFENISFSWYLTHDANFLPRFISQVTAIKTIVYAHNLLVSTIGLVILVVGILKQRLPHYD
ncbi:MAG: hypothetical protein QM768_20240 [Agriterribacter sp.]